MVRYLPDTNIVIDVLKRRQITGLTRIIVLFLSNSISSSLM